MFTWAVINKKTRLIMPVPEFLRGGRRLGAGASRTRISVAIRTRIGHTRVDTSRVAKTKIFFIEFFIIK